MQQKGPVAKEKRRFVPKAQSKNVAEPTVPPPASTMQPTSSKTSNSQPNRRGSDGGGHGRGAGRGRGGRGRSKSGRGGGRFVVPTGKAFFTGGSATTGLAHTSSTVHPDHTQPPPIIRSEGSVISGSVSRIKLEKGVTCESTCPTQNELNDHDNSNDSTNTGEDNHELDLKTCDEWPPRDFDPLAPVELPFGPRNTSKRLQLTNMNVFAETTDKAALDKEENESMFLVQLPSSITKHRNDVPSDAHVGGDREEMKPSGQLKPGIIGKIQITKSGKMRLLVYDEFDEDVNLGSGGKQVRRKRGDSTVSEDGRSISSSQKLSNRIRRYELNRGIFPSFMQIVTSISTIDSSSKSYSKNIQDNGPARVFDPDGGEKEFRDFNFLGQVTDKIVVTPDYDIGQRQSTPFNSRKRSGSSVDMTHFDPDKVTMIDIKNEVT